MCPLPPLPPIFLFIYIYVCKMVSKWEASAFLCWLFGNPSSQDSVLHSYTYIDAEWNCVTRN